MRGSGNAYASSAIEPGITVAAAGKRLYGEAELHRLTIVKMLQDTGLLSLEDIALILHGPEVGDWRAAIRVRTEEIVEQRRKLTVAETFLGQFARCPRDHPVETCPSLRAYTERVLAEDK
ncbi:MerR family DNA-binding protein [Amycolatopsis carbonis]|uniref:MerR family DNA-binding protein n=1 Tax=Amycolatopsis carbonis TaxID=715471 RepID=A0A9Y2IKT2_9PSEU|nr:MerR family DNA-binding protein [Amycolatopsis sp. 2-15]WIX81076.1 MerR family DNA-binding protein [Amycolatopsis sp. 2-15]